MKKDYLVLGYIKSNLKYENEERFFVKVTNNDQEEQLKIVIGKTDLEISNDINNIEDMQITVTIKAESSLEAIVLAKSHTESILNSIAFTSNGRINRCDFYKAISCEEVDNIRDFCQLDFEILSNIAKKDLNIEKFSELIKQTNNNNYKHKGRIDRAIAFYQKGVSSKDILEKFNYYWISLECLNPIFSKTFPKAVDINKCEKCGFEKTNMNTAPLKKAFKDYLDNEKLYSQARKIRVSLVHGTKDIVKIEKDIIDMIDDFEDSAYKLISTILKINYDKQYSVADEDEGLTFEVHFEITNYKLFDDNGKPTFPNIDIEMEISEVNNELLLKPIIKSDFFNKCCGMKSVGWDCYGTCGRDIKKIQLVING